MLTNVFNISALALDADTVEMMWQVPILGMAMIFSVLGILWAVLALFKVVFAGKTPKAEKPQRAVAKKADSAPKESATAQPTGDDLMAVLTAAIAAHQSNDEIIAVLTAAVSAYRAESGESGGFRVVAFKRANTRAWNRK